MAKTNLFDEFDAVSPKAWKQKIQFDLKGADYNESLLWESPEGIKVKPFYTSEDTENGLPFPKKVSTTWKIAQTIYAGNATMANSKALHAIEKGAESLIFTIPSEEIQIGKLVNNINLEHIPIHLNFQFLSESYVKSIVNSLTGPTSQLYCHTDIIGNLTRTGNWYFNLEKDHEIFKVVGENHIPNFISVDATLYQNAGATMVQQLAYALAHANEYLNFLELYNCLPYTTKITFKVAVGGNYFFEIAKLRALRLLWHTLRNEYRITTDCHIIATPSFRNKTIYDYNTNMLRTTTECMSAILGGADTLVNMPYDAIYHKDNEFGERIARNQLLLLKHESYFDKVANPVDGSYYIESITRQLSERALELFKNMEAGGGFLKQLKDHTLQRRIKESAQKEQSLFDSHQAILVGTNKYESGADKMKATINRYPFVKVNSRKTLLEPLLERRLAEALEQKRLNHE